MKWLNLVASVTAVMVLVAASAVVSGEKHKLFSAQIKSINGEVEKWYQEEWADGNEGFFQMTHTALQQCEEHHWPRRMVRVLQVATGINFFNPIDRVKIARTLAGLQLFNEPVMMEFLERFWNYLGTKFKYESNFDSSLGQDKYVKAIIEFMNPVKEQLCLPYRDNTEGSFNFYNAINELVRLKQVENVSSKEFLDKVVFTTEPISLLYATAKICQAIDGVIGTVLPDQQLDLHMSFTEVHKKWPYEVQKIEEAQLFARVQVLNQEVVSWYEEELNAKIEENLRRGRDVVSVSVAHRQSEIKQWPIEMMRVLQVATGVSLNNRISMRNVINVTAGLKQNILSTQVEFIENFSQYLATSFDFKSKTIDFSEFVEQTNEQLCKAYDPNSKRFTNEGSVDVKIGRNVDNVRTFTFDGMISETIKLARLDGIDEKMFTELFVLTDHPLAALYSAIMICRVIENIDGTVDKDGQLQLNIPFNSKRLIRNWPYIVS